MSSNHHTTDGPVFMNLGGRHRNMTIEPFEEEEPEFPQYGEFKRQIEQLINTKTHSNIFRPEPHNKEIGTSAEEQEKYSRPIGVCTTSLMSLKTVIVTNNSKRDWCRLELRNSVFPFWSYNV